jgi:hypothetical protein
MPACPSLNPISMYRWSAWFCISDAAPEQPRRSVAGIISAQNGQQDVVRALLETGERKLLMLT